MNPPLHLFDCPPLFITLMRELDLPRAIGDLLNERVWVSVIMPRGIISWISGGKSSSAKLRAIAVWLLPTRCAIALASNYREAPRAACIRALLQ